MYNPALISSFPYGYKVNPYVVHIKTKKCFSVYSGPGEVQFPKIIGELPRISDDSRVPNAAGNKDVLEVPRPKQGN